MARSKLELINNQQVEKILDEAYSILEKVGVLVENKEAMQLLGDAGATINIQNQKAFFPKSLIESSVKSAPSSIIVYDRDGEVALSLEEENIH